MRIFDQILSRTPSHPELLDAARAAVRGTAHWIVVCERDLTARRQHAWHERPSWIWTNNDQFRAQALAAGIFDYRGGQARQNACPRWAISKGRVLLCHILNAFAAKLTDYDGTPLEMPSEDVGTGILPVLYHLVRCDYLWNARIARCAWKDCTRWFRIGRHESPCCCSEHSLKHRQSEYYRRKGKDNRALHRNK
jgi:hypothetical protein